MIESNFSITKLFVTKEIIVYNQEEGWSFILKLPTINDYYDNSDFSGAYYLWTLDEERYKKIVQPFSAEDSFDFLQLILFHIGHYAEFKSAKRYFTTQLPKILPTVQINKEQKIITVKNKINNKLITLTPEIWNYIIYLLKLSCGEKVEAPVVFTDPEAKAFYLAQKEAEKEVQRIKSQAANGGQDGIPKTILNIVYAFPSLTYDYLLNQTLAQIHWLAKYAAGAVSYDFKAKAYAAGNAKKGSKLDFFIK